MQTGNQQKDTIFSEFKNLPPEARLAFITAKKEEFEKTGGDSHFHQENNRLIRELHQLHENLSKPKGSHAL